MAKSASTPGLGMPEFDSERHTPLEPYDPVKSTPEAIAQQMEYARSQGATVYSDPSWGR